MNIVKCRRCGEQIDKRVDEFVKLSNGYAHKECEEKFQIKKNTVICRVCHCGINKLTDNFIKRTDGYVHESCVSTADKDKAELCNYICEIFHLKTPGPANNKLISKFHTENGYSYKSMYYTLKYHFEVKNGSVEKAQERIGIIPYVYDEAKKYYDNLSATRNRLSHTVEEQIKQKEEVIIIRNAPKRKKKDIDLEGLA